MRGDHYIPEDGLSHVSKLVMEIRIDLTLVAARLGFVGDRTGPDSASDHSSVEIEIVGFLIWEHCLEKHREECS